ncbi:hypothetical protein [uncultured Methanobrevibacter sp.]|uniref:hypothetical protein n=1 Tax=uncultured Methanobrevibacter sp. TaxID=253161 RepID=UPI00263101EE
MRFFVLSKKENFDKSHINDALLNSVNATSLIADNCIKKETDKLAVYLYTYNMAYDEDENNSYKMNDEEISFVNGLFVVEDSELPNNLENIDFAMKNDKLILGSYQAFHCDENGNGYFQSSLSSIHPLFYYEDENCSVIANELKLIVDGVKAFQNKTFRDNYDAEYMEDLIKFGNWYKTDKKTTYRNTAFKNIKRIFPFDELTVQNGQFEIILNDEIEIPEWIENLYIEDREGFYDWYYRILEEYTDKYFKIISPKIRQIKAGITGGFDSRLTLMILKKLASKHNIELKSITNGLREHPDVIIGEKVAKHLDVDWENDLEEENKYKYFPSSFKQFATTFYISQGDFDSHDTTDEYTREYLNRDQFYQHGNDLYKHNTINTIKNIGRWSSRRRLFNQEFYLPLFGTCLEIWIAFLLEKHSEDGFKEFVYHVLKRGDEDLLDIPFAMDSLPQTGVDEFTVEGYVDSRHLEEPFLWDYNYILDKLGPLFQKDFDKQNEKYNSVLEKSDINALDYFILKNKINNVLKKDLDEKKTKLQLRKIKKNAFYPKKRTLIDQKKYEKVTSFTVSIFLMDYSAASDFNSFESLEKAASFNSKDDYLERADEAYERINELKKENEKIKKDNKNIEKEIKKLKKTNKEILSSKSWKLTSGLRKIRN